VSRPLHVTTVDAFDQAWQPLLERVAGMTDAEYHWLPVAGAWTVRDADGSWLADWEDPDPVPAPVTTIAWRLWHIADALDGYAGRLFGRTGNELAERVWVGTWAEAEPLLRAAGDVFREGVAGWGDDVFEPLGDHWGPFARHSRLDLLFHALREVNHHGAEVALLRDLYGAR